MEQPETTSDGTAKQASLATTADRIRRSFICPDGTSLLSGASPITRQSFLLLSAMARAGSMEQPAVEGRLPGGGHDSISDSDLFDPGAYARIEGIIRDVRTPSNGSSDPVVTYSQQVEDQNNNRF